MPLVKAWFEDPTRKLGSRRLDFHQHIDLSITIIMIIAIINSGMQTDDYVS